MVKSDLGELTEARRLLGRAAEGWRPRWRRAAPAAGDGPGANQSLCPPGPVPDPPGALRQMPGSGERGAEGIGSSTKPGSADKSPALHSKASGFSRGAYTVRSLAGLIYNSGLPSREHVKKIPEAKEPDGEDAIKFRTRFGEQVPIKALCCWDTVAELGVPDLLPGINLDAKFNERYRFHNDKLNKTIEHAFHAVSIDESRREFYYTPMMLTSIRPLSSHKSGFISMFCSTAIRANPLFTSGLMGTRKELSSLMGLSLNRKSLKCPRGCSWAHWISSQR